MATLVLQPPSSDVHSRMGLHSFKGDNDMLVDRLIAASARKEVAADSLVERTLVPFFDDSEASAASFQALQSSGRRTIAPAASNPVAVPGSLKRHAHERSTSHLAGSPPRKEGQVLQAKHARRSGKPAVSGGSASGGSSSDTEMTSPPTHSRKPRTSGGKKHQRDASAAAGAAKSASTASGIAGQRQSPPRKRPEAANGAPLDMRQLAAAAAAAGPALRTPGGGKGAAARAPLLPAVSNKFAGPAFTNSPTPDSLPIPTSSLLLAQAADSLRARLTL